MTDEIRFSHEGLSDLAVSAMRNAHHHGACLGGWYGGNAHIGDASDARALLDALAAGHEVEIGPHDVLSGEWADDPTQREVLVANAGEYWDTLTDDEEDAILSAFTDGFDEGFWTEVMAYARRIIRDAHEV